MSHEFLLKWTDIWQFTILVAWHTSPIPSTLPRHILCRTTMLYQVVRLNFCLCGCTLIRTTFTICFDTLLMNHASLLPSHKQKTNNCATQYLHTKPMVPPCLPLSRTYVMMKRQFVYLSLQCGATTIDGAEQ